MPTLNIEGRRIKVDDSFLSLSSDQQNAQVDEIAKSIGTQPESRMERFGHGLADPIYGAAQIGARMPEEGIPPPGEEEQRLARTTAVDTAIKKREHDIQAARPPGERGTTDWYRLGGSALTGTALSAPSLALGPVAGGIVGGMMGAATEPIADVKDFASQKAESMAWGATAGGILGFAGKMAGTLLRGLTTPPERAEALKYLRSRGVEPTAAEISGSRALRKSESTLGEAPGAGGAYSAVKEKELRQYTRAAVEHMGVDADNALPETINRARDQAAAKLESAAKTMRIKDDAKLGNDLGEIATDLTKEGATDDQIKRITAQIDNVLKGFVTTKPGQAVMDGATYQNLTKHGTPLQRAIDSEDSVISYYALRVRSALDDAMERTATGRGTRPGVGQRKALEDLQSARREWYNMLVISKAVTGPGDAAPAGLVTPQKLRQILTNSQDKKLQYAAGRGDMHDLARAGDLLMAPIGTSQSAERSLITTIPAALGAATGQALHGEPISGALLGAVGPGLAGRALMSSLGQTALKGELPVQSASRALLESPTGERSARALRTALSAGAGSALAQPELP